MILPKRRWRYLAFVLVFILLCTYAASAAADRPPSPADVAPSAPPAAPIAAAADGSLTPPPTPEDALRAPRLAVRSYYPPAEATTTPSPISPTPLSAPARPPRVTAVGDSVLLAAADILSRALDDVSVDAVVGRPVPEAIAVLQARRAAGQIGEVVLIHIGNNGPLSAGQFDQMMGLAAGARQIVFVNLKAPRDWEATNNAVLAAGVGRYPNAVLLDWHAASVGRPEYFWDDAIHLRPAGARAYADLVLPYLAEP